MENEQLTFPWLRNDRLAGIAWLSWSGLIDSTHPELVVRVLVQVGHSGCARVWANFRGPGPFATFWLLLNYV